MRLKSLKVYKTTPGYENIREIEFNEQGLSLIVDDTKGVISQTGNSVGKSTVIKIIDLCLEAKSVKELYKGKEAEGENVEIRDLLNNNKVQADLEIITDGKIHTFTRSLYARGPRKYNGEKKTQNEYKEKLKEVLFASTLSKPTIRQLIPKFVRTDDQQLNNILYYLVSTTKEDYEAIYLFLLKIGLEELISERQELEMKLRGLERKSNIYKKDINIPSEDYIKQSLSLIDKELEELNLKRNNLDYVSEYTEEIEGRTDYNAKIESLNSDIQLLKFQENTIGKSLDAVVGENTDIDIELLGSIYADANLYNESMNKKFGQVVEFHNRMVKNRYNFIKKQKDKVKQKLRLLESVRKEVLKEKERFSIELVDAGLLEQLEKVNREIDEMNIRKGELQKADNILNDLKDEMHCIEDKLESINKQEADDVYLQPINHFNNYFSKYSNQLYGEKYMLIYNSKWREDEKYPFLIGNLQGNLGTGKQRALSVVFDMSFVEYATDHNIVAPKFLIYDQMENTHINQLESLFDIAKEYSGQLVIPILKERLNSIDEEIIEESTVIRLSQEDKFFRV